MITSAEILNLVTQYVKTQDLDAFAASFAEVFYDIEDTGDTDAIQLAYEIETELAAVTAGVCSEAALYAAMKVLSPSLSIVICEANIEEPQSVMTYGLLTKSAAAAAGTVKLAYVGIAPSVGFGSKTVVPSTPQTNTDPLLWQQVTGA